MYPKTRWIDEVRDQQTGVIIQEGTDQSAANFNNAEFGISDAHIAGAIFMVAALQTQRRNDNNIAGEVIEATLTNTLSLPFNDSLTTVGLSMARANTNYDVGVDVLSATGTRMVGDVIVSDKQLNGFKIKFTGSASSVTVRLRIRGGLSA